VLDEYKSKNIPLLLIRELIHNVIINFGEDALALITFYEHQERIYKRIFGDNVLAKSTIHDDGIFKEGTIGLMSIKYC